jgi:hypothetical protein
MNETLGTTFTGAPAATINTAPVSATPNSVDHANLTGRPQEDSLTLAGALNVERTFSSAKAVFTLTPATSKVFGLGLLSWWDASQSKLQPNAVDTTYVIVVSFQMKPVSMVQLPTVIAELDISPARDGSRIIRSDKETLIGTTYETVNLVLHTFARDTFFANGGQITLRTIDGDITAINPTLFIKGK